jgi:UrcA family protein
MNMNRLATIVLAAASLAIAAPALAATDFVAKVKTSDLDLNTDTGVKTALERVHRAALHACSDVTVGSRIAAADEQCVAEVGAELVKRINAPLVQAAFDASKAGHGERAPAGIRTRQDG